MQRYLKSLASSFAPKLRTRLLARVPKLRQLLINRFETLPPKNPDGTVSFLGQRWESHSQARQDVFVQVFSMFHPARSYLEIGAKFPMQGNNTFVLEKQGWTGISVEIDGTVEPLWSIRDRERLVIADALTLEYEKVVGDDQVLGGLGYLQIDIEPPSNSLRALTLIASVGVNFACVTFEHDFYGGGKRERIESRRMLRDLGYQPVVFDVEWAPGKLFEDWWIHPSFFPPEMSALPTSNNWFSADAEDFLKNLAQR